MTGEDRNRDNAVSGANPGGIFQRIFAIFAGIGDSEAEKRKFLRGIAKDLSRSRYKFYRPKGQEALPGMAKYLHEIYKIAAPVQVLLGNSASSGALRSYVIESLLTPEERELSERLTEEYIVERAKTVSPAQLQADTKRDLTAFFTIFYGEKSNQIDGVYNTLLAFINFVNFDYFFLLKKFDSSLPERSSSYKPKFGSINGKFITEELQDFLEVFCALDLNADWTSIFATLKDYKKTDVVAAAAWAKFLLAASELRKSMVLDQIVRHLKEDPFWKSKPHRPNEHIVEPFLQKLKTQIEAITLRIVQERRNSKIDEIAHQVFGTSVIIRMNNYTEKANAVFTKKMLGGYTQTLAMNYLRAFLMDFFKKDIHELIDLLIIRGQWTVNLQSQQLSDCYHAILEVSAKIVEFDEGLADEGEIGTRMRSALAKVERDKEAGKYLRGTLKEINDKATTLISRGAVNLIGLGRQIKSLIEDLTKPHHEMIINWKEVENQSQRPFKPWIVETYKKIYYIVQLLQYFVGNKEST
jgi:Family of unknown function (DUF5312)